MKKYLLVIIEKCKNVQDEWVINAQDGSLPIEVHRGSHENCVQWAKDNSEECISYWIMPLTLRSHFICAPFFNQLPSL